MNRQETEKAKYYDPFLTLPILVFWLNFRISHPYFVNTKYDMY